MGEQIVSHLVPSPQFRKFLELLTSLHLHRSGRFHLLYVWEEPALGVLDHPIAGVNFTVALKSELVNMVYLHLLVQVTELSRAEIGDVFRVEEVIYLDVWRCSFHSMRRYGVESILRRGGSSTTREEGRE